MEPAMTSSRLSVCFAIVVGLMTCLCPGAMAQVAKQRGATLGGLAGAAAGGLIGDHNGKAGAGAVIGGLVGAVAGGVLGDASDKENAFRQQQYYYQQQQQQQQQMVPMQGVVTVSDVISMSRGGLSDHVIINQVQRRGFAQQLQVSDIIALHQQGVSESVITALQSAPIGGQVAARPAPPMVHEQIITPAPIIVREHHVLPHYPPPRYYYYRGATPGYYSSSSLNIRF